MSYLNSLLKKKSDPVNSELFKQNVSSSSGNEGAGWEEETAQRRRRRRGWHRTSKRSEEESEGWTRRRRKRRWRSRRDEEAGWSSKEGKTLKPLTQTDCTYPQHHDASLVYSVSNLSMFSCIQYGRKLINYRKHTFPRPCMRVFHL